MNKEKTKKKWWQILLITLAWIIGIILVFVICLFAYLTATEYRPKDREPVKISGAAAGSIAPGDDLKILTWNCGYGALGDNADFFMDGGDMVQTASEARVRKNIQAIKTEIQKESPDVAFLQEVDISSKRSYKINEVQYFANAMKGYQSTFATNFKVAYDPYPIPPMGKIYSGIQTLSSLPIDSAVRVKLPCPFKWPVRIGNLKRCLLVSRVPLKGSNKELVLVNLHLEAFDSGEGKIAQTKLLRKVLEDEVKKGNYVIAGGDFNQVFSNTDMSKYKQDPDKWTPGFIDTADFSDFQMIQDSSLPTCRSLDKVLYGADTTDFQWYVLDGFIVSNNIQINSVKTQDLGFKNTDHNPVIMQAVLK